MKYGFLQESLASSTRATYATGVRHYMVFCAQSHLRTLPLVEEVVEDFCVSLSRRVGYKTLKVYLCGLQYASVMQGFSTGIKGMRRLYYVLRGIRKVQGNSHTRPPRTPVSLNMLTNILSYLHSNYISFDAHMLSAAILLAFFGMLRISEYTSPYTQRFDRDTNLQLADVTVRLQSQIITVRIKSSKTDPFRVGAHIRVGATGNHLCPFTALIRYLNLRGGSPGPLFVFSDCSFLVRRHVATILRLTSPANQNVNTHSLRQGGASSLAARGIPKYIIQILGRWSSDAYKAYLHFQDSFITTANINMALQ